MKYVFEKVMTILIVFFGITSLAGLAELSSSNVYKNETGTSLFVVCFGVLGCAVTIFIWYLHDKYKDRKSSPVAGDGEKGSER
jgi:hypothetical protein